MTGTRRKRLLLLLLLVTACTSGTRAEILDTSFPGRLVRIGPALAHATQCDRSSCFAGYEIEITNPTDRDANVQECRLPADPHTIRFIVGPPSGEWVRAGSHVRAQGSRIFPLSLVKLQALVGADLACIGLDWHGHPPI